MKDGPEFLPEDDGFEVLEAEMAAQTKTIGKRIDEADSNNAATEATTEEETKTNSSNAAADENIVEQPLEEDKPNLISQ